MDVRLFSLLFAFASDLNQPKIEIRGQGKPENLRKISFLA